MSYKLSIVSKDRFLEPDFLNILAGDNLRGDLLFPSMSLRTTFHALMKEGIT